MTGFLSAYLPLLLTDEEFPGIMNCDKNFKHEKIIATDDKYSDENSKSCTTIYMLMIPFLHVFACSWWKLLNYVKFRKRN